MGYKVMKTLAVLTSKRILCCFFVSEARFKRHTLKRKKWLYFFNNTVQSLNIRGIKVKYVSVIVFRVKSDLFTLLFLTSIVPSTCYFLVLAIVSPGI